MSNAISKAIKKAGSQKKLADACGISQAAVSKWFLGGAVSAESARAIERATEGAVTVHDLRPDIFGPAPGIAPPAPAQERAA